MTDTPASLSEVWQLVWWCSLALCGKIKVCSCRWISLCKI